MNSSLSAGSPEESAALEFLLYSVGAEWAEDGLHNGRPVSTIFDTT